MKKEIKLYIIIGLFMLLFIWEFVFYSIPYIMPYINWMRGISEDFIQFIGIILGDYL